MKRHCPGCRRLRAEAEQPGADLDDILARVALHETAAHPRRPPPPRSTKPLAVRR
ncbi:hypothetical protein [Streptomyces sp. NPDC045470]|uniref:hypothetical protein n=1 Tax=Streptomyces sp. NPDC045470 TaxID=3155469 RepID=UPI0033F6012F